MPLMEVITHSVCNNDIHFEFILSDTSTIFEVTGYYYR